MWLALCPCLSCGVTLQATCLAVPLLLQACDHSEVASNIQFGVQVPENCDVRLIAAWGKKNIDLFNSQAYRYVPSKKGVFT